MRVAKTRYVLVIPPFSAYTGDDSIELNATWTKRTRDHLTGRATDEQESATLTAERLGPHGETDFQVPPDNVRDLAATADTITLHDLKIAPFRTFAAPVTIEIADPH